MLGPYGLFPMVAWLILPGGSPVYGGTPVCPCIWLPAPIGFMLPPIPGLG